MASISLLFIVLNVLSFLRFVVGQSERKFTLELSRGRWAPDGVEREMILVNGQYPPPNLEIWEDDDVVVEVFNGLEEPSSIHFHGIEMRNTPWSDGAPGLSQRPIPSGHNFTYRWKATQHGSYWYHSHSGEQVEDGLYGALTIHPRAGTLKPFSLISESSAGVEALERAEREAQPVLMSDHRHVTGREVWEFTQRASCFPPRVMAVSYGADGYYPAMPANILEGCHATDALREVIEVQGHSDSGGDENWVALHFIGAFHGISSMVSIDEHPMWVFAVDGGYITPQLVHAIPIMNGERFSVFIKADKAGDFAIRIAATMDPQILDGYATLRVSTPGEQSSGDSSAPYIDAAGHPTSGDVVIFDPNTSKPFPPSPIPPVADKTFIMYMGNSVPAYLWELNVEPLLPLQLERETPLLLEPRPPSHHIFETTNDTWVDLVFITHTSPNPPHPIHKHGVKMHLLGLGYGSWTWASVEEAARDIPGSFNLVDPPVKDSFTSLKVGINDRQHTAWLAVRYHVNNPGAWLLHCHVLEHLNGGMQVVLLDGVDAWPEMPEEYRRLAEGSG
ncbi:related to laccase precursor [Cephalotrichum gorgonifer]|uniref:Related to laccase n=1 Tax=Cephalotrichum gorgonifer TaxID=2041049 RepID=A0AAE8MRM2_9PEZI|nr:related to laccase precursor [Cephalotrichum gorgonifer]